MGHSVSKMGDGAAFGVGEGRWEIGGVKLGGLGLAALFLEVGKEGLAGWGEGEDAFAGEGGRRR